MTAKESLIYLCANHIVLDVAKNTVKLIDNGCTIEGVDQLMNEEINWACDIIDKAVNLISQLECPDAELSDDSDLGSDIISATFYKGE